MDINNNWTLYYKKPITEKEQRSVGDFDDSFSKITNISLPCVLETALFNAKMLGDPYYGSNAYEYQKYEDCHQWYVTKFDSPFKRGNIRFHGVDTLSEIYLNGVLLGKTDNMFIPFDFEANFKEKDNELIVHIIPSATYGSLPEGVDALKGNACNKNLHIRASGSEFGWDILPRFCAGGLWKGVSISEFKPYLDKVLITTKSIEKDKAVIAFTFQDRDDVKSIRIEGKHKDSSFAFEGDGNKKKVEVEVNNPYLWHVVGYGEPNLYDINIKVVFVGGREETRNMRFGIRIVKLHRTSIVQDDGCFEFHVNGEKVFILGSNYVPIDAIRHVDNDRSKKAIDYLLDLGCNAFRVWGGGVFETEEFYSLCDEKGIFIWHDFMMACVKYPHDDEFISNLTKEVRDLILRYGYHSSICLWSGDNECDQAYGWNGLDEDPNTNIITRKVIPSLVAELNPERDFLPSSPYIDEEAFHHRDLMSEDHLWGPRDYFRGEYYTNNKCYFASETGYHGCPSPKSLDTFIEHKWPLYKHDKVPTDEYMCHATSSVNDINAPYAYRIELMDKQVKTLFGKDMDNIDDFAKASQISQAEAMKYFIERFRRRRNTHGGIIWWNLIDGWPQVSDAVTGYDFSKKLAYHYIKQSQQKDLLIVEEKDDLFLFHLVSEEETPSFFEWEVKDGQTGELLVSGECNMAPRSASAVGVLWKKSTDKKFLILTIRKEDGTEYINHYVSDIKGIDFDTYNRVMEKYGFLKWEGF